MDSPVLFVTNSWASYSISPTKKVLAIQSPIIAPRFSASLKVVCAVPIGTHPKECRFLQTVFHVCPLGYTGLPRLGNSVSDSFSCTFSFPGEETLSALSLQESCLFFLQCVLPGESAIWFCSWRRILRTSHLSADCALLMTSSGLKIDRPSCWALSIKLVRCKNMHVCPFPYPKE